MMRSFVTRLANIAHEGSIMVRNSQKNACIFLVFFFWKSSQFMVDFLPYLVYLLILNHLLTERLDQDTSGIVTTGCDHSFQCSCISKWANSSCPVSSLMLNFYFQLFNFETTEKLLSSLLVLELFKYLWTYFHWGVKNKYPAVHVVSN